MSVASTDHDATSTNAIQHILNSKSTLTRSSAKTAKGELKKRSAPWTVIWSVLISRISVPNQESSALTGVVKMVSALGAFATVMLAFMVMIAAKPHALLANTMMNQQILAYLVALLEPMKISSHVPAFLAILPAPNVGMSQ